VKRKFQFHPTNLSELGEPYSSFPSRQPKICDESHFVSRQLHHVHTIGPVVVPGYFCDSAYLADSFSLALLTNLSTPANPFFIYLHVDSAENDFINAFKAAIAAPTSTTRGLFYYY